MNQLQPFSPHPWLGHRHLQTVAGAAVRPGEDIAPERHWVPSAHGDRLLLERLPGEPGAPRVLLLHGLSGSSRTPAMRSAMLCARRAGFEVLALNMRGSELCPATIPRLHHAGSSDDLEAVVSWLLPGPPLYLGGFSLGANIMLKWLGERGDAVPREVHAACAVCSPLDLAGCAEQLEADPVSRIYRWHLVSRLKARALELCEAFPGILSEPRIKAAVTFRDFDGYVTASLHGYQGADDYWSHCSSLNYLAGIKRATLLVNARDDPFLPPGVLDRVPDSPWLVRDFPHQGGHIGFIGSDWKPWAEGRMIGFFQEARRAAGSLSR